MKRVFWLGALFAVAFLCQPAFGQSADKVIARYTKSHAKGALKRVTSTVLIGAVAGPDGTTGRFELRAVGPERVRREIRVGDTSTVDCYNGKSAWRLDSTGTRTVVDDAALHARLAAILANSRYQQLSRYRIVARTVGSTSVDGQPAVAVAFMLKGASQRVYFHSQTGLPLKHDRTVDGQLEETFFGDYRRVDGVMEPFALRIVRGGAECRVAVEKVEHNVPVDETAFRVPVSTGSRSLPDLQTLVAAIRANQERVQQITELYAFRETMTEREEDGRGGVRDKVTRVYNVLPVHGRFVRELVSVDGKELTAGEKEKEQKRVREAIEEIVERKKKDDERAAKAAREGKPEKEDRDDITIGSFLRTSEISSVRRETFRGRELLAFDFEPRPDFKPSSFAESIASKLAGTIWVDESALQVVRLEARLTNKVKVGGGLVGSLSPDSTVVLEQAKVNEEIWLPSFTELNLTGKLLLLKSIRVNVVARYDDFRRYSVDSTFDAQAETPPAN